MTFDLSCYWLNAKIKAQTFVYINPRVVKSMQVRNFLISTFRGQNNFFELFKTEDLNMGVVTRVFEPFMLVENNYENVELKSVDLPFEIIYIILEKLAEEYLIDQDIGEACKIAYVNKIFFKHFYTRYVGKYPIGLKKSKIAVFRYSNTFKTTGLLLEASQCELPYEESRNICYSLQYSKGAMMCNGSTFAPYNFSNNEIEVTSCFHDMVISPNNYPLKSYPNGPSVYDSVWMVGTNFDGIYTSTEVYHPGIVINLCNSTFAVIPKLEWFQNNQGFKVWSKMLKLVYGTESKIFFVVGFITAGPNAFAGRKIIFSFD